MSTVDIAEVRRRLERYVTLCGRGPDVNDHQLLVSADLTLAYLPMLLDELDELREWSLEASE